MGIDYHYHYPRCTEDHRFDFSAGWSRTRIWSPFQGGREPKVAHLGPLCPKKSDWQSRLEPNVSSGRVSCDVRLSWCPRQHLFKDGEQERALNFSGDDRSLVKLLHPNLPGSLLSSIVSWRRNHLRPWDKNSKTCLYKFYLESWMDEMCPHLHAAVVPCPKSSRQHGGFEITLHQNGGADSVSSHKVQVEICARHFKMTCHRPSPTSPETPFGFALTIVKRFSLPSGTKSCKRNLWLKCQFREHIISCTVAVCSRSIIIQYNTHSI